MRIIQLSIFLALVLTAGALCGNSTVRASEREIVKKEKRLEDVKKRIRETERSIKEIFRTETTILGEVEKVSRTIAKKREELERVNASLKGITREINKTDANLRVLEKEREAFLKRLRLRLGAMYKMRKGGALKVLFASENSRDLGRRYKYMAMIMGSDSRLIEKSEKNLAILTREKERLKGLRHDLSSSRERLSVAKTEAESRLKEKKELLKGVKRKKEKHLKLMEEFETAKVELTELISMLGEGGATGLKGAFAAMKGHLTMPVNGKVVSSYGKVKHPRFNTVTFNNGIVIEAPFGSHINSVYKGKVVYVGWLKGYGQVVIVDHGSGFYTLYGHLYKVLKGRGETVEAGEEVGLVGDSGPHEVSGLYFEVRQGGVPRDPMVWIASR
jgi:septal ring factor EnvC (AmiA/AmiB activator)